VYCVQWAETPQEVSERVTAEMTVRHLRGKQASAALGCRIVRSDPIRPGRGGRCVHDVDEFMCEQLASLGCLRRVATRREGNVILSSECGSAEARRRALGSGVRVNSYVAEVMIEAVLHLCADGLREGFTR
jgi:hypothetical protein